MKLGDVLYFESDQAQGHTARRKYHVFLGVTDYFRADHPNAFMYISSSDYDDCFSLKSQDYPFLSHDSFISCGRLIFYPDGYLAQVSTVTVGSILMGQLVALRNHLVGHDVLSSWEINLACGFLPATL